MNLRHYLRYVVNGLSVVVALSTLPEFGSVVPVEALPGVAILVTMLNTVLTWARVYAR